MIAFNKISVCRAHRCLCVFFQRKQDKNSHFKEDRKQTFMFRKFSVIGQLEAISQLNRKLHIFGYFS